GVLQASCALPLATIRRMIEPVHPGADQPPSRTPPPPHAVRWPTCGAPRRVVMRGWTSHRDVVDTGCAPERSLTRCVRHGVAPPTAPVRRHPARRPPTRAVDRGATACERRADGGPCSSETPIAIPHHGVRRPLPTPW